MRLICANCGAQYEISDSAIPLAGREVQCSSCGYGWFHKPGGQMPDPDAAPAPLPRRPVDEQVLSVLREEAAREAEARRKAAATPAPAADAGLTPVATEPPASVAEPEVPAPAQEPAAAEAAAPALTETPAEVAKPEPVAAPLPRAWEPEPGPVDMPVNRALGDYDGDGDARSRRSFRTGFVCGLLLIAALVALYMVGPDLSRDVPSLAPSIATYVENVDTARSWIDDLIRSAMQSIGR